ncbi:MAG: DUF268 domain-containing protein [Pirellulaceae bacterium]|jgi:hypothetical protein|nr:DUF268 domain-containing protein [Pirellulaceae bacterium]
MREWIRLGRHVFKRGFQPKMAFRATRGIGAYLADLRTLRRQYSESKREFPLARSFPCLDERFAQSGVTIGHYFHQDLLVARWVFQDAPDKHVDVGSRVDGFVAHVASFREIEVLDIRPQKNTVQNIRFEQADMMETEFAKPAYTSSASCLHALEHFGLGRYGDNVDYYGYLKGWANLHTLLKPRARLYFSVPMGEQRIEFNAHRVFGLPYLRSMIDPLYNIKRFAYVDDSGSLHDEADIDAPEAATSFGCRYGCGIFSLLKR